MILRSVMRHVREQNWFAVGLDFFIVVVGVFIGIQVANWNAERADWVEADYLSLVRSLYGVFDCETGLSSTEIAAAAAALREHPDVLPALRLRAMNLRTSISDLTEAAADIAEGLRPFVEAAP